MSRKIIEIGANLIDDVFQGIYRGKKVHEADFEQMLERAWNVGVEKIILTSGTLEDTIKALEITNKYENIFTTIGVHPTRTQTEFEGNYQDYLEKMLKISKENKEKIISIGEIGLDFDKERLNFSSKEIQKKFLNLQLNFLKELDLPLFLHCRDSIDDLLEILNLKENKFRGVFHSFTGNVEEAKKIVDAGFFIGINGCSLKTQFNLDVIKTIPIESIMIETGLFLIFNF